MDTLRIAYAFFTTTSDKHPWVDFDLLKARYAFIKGQQKFGEK